MDFLHKEDSNGTLIDFIKNRKKQFNGNSDEGTQKQQILEELHVSKTFSIFDKFIVFNVKLLCTFDIVGFFISY